MTGSHRRPEMTSSDSLDYWRKLFRSAGSDIFQVVETAIHVAASDHPDEFLIRRDRIAEKLFTCRLDWCVGCDRIREPTRHDEEEDADPDPPPGSNFSYDEAEALTEEIEEENEIVGEVLRIKRILENHQEQSGGTLFDSLRRLQLMALSVEALKATEIGRAVNRLRKHGSKEIRNLVRALIDGWKLLVDEWVNTAPAIPDNSPDSVNPSSLDEEEGLPFPPLDEGALFATQTTSIQLSEFFDGMDDDGNLRNEGEFARKRESEKRPLENKPVRKQQPRTIPEPKVQRTQEPSFRQMRTKLEEAPNGESKPRGISGPGRPATKVGCNSDLGVRKNTTTTTQDISKNSEDASVRAKLEVAKRKLQERYQQAENAKRQRTIQVMELHDLPKQAHRNVNKLSSNAKQKSNIRNWASGRR